jgi:CRP-like cAMP-binding protein
MVRMHPPGGLLHSHENHLIAALPLAERSRLLALCEPVHLVLAQVLCEPGQTSRHVYFPTDSFVSLITQVDAQHSLEVGMAGREGMLGVQAALGVAREPLKALVQGAGAAWRIGAVALREELAHNAPLQQRLLRYASVLLAQRATASACVRFHEIGPRLARWLLMSQDRAHTDQFPMTQEFLASMLGVRRVGVTTAAGDLQRRGLIRYHRGDLAVVNRPGLLAAACSCYAADLQIYQQALPARITGGVRQRGSR